MSGWRGALLAWLALWGGQAAADDGFFDLDTVLVATFEVEDEFDQADADRLRERVQEALEGSYLVMGMEDVPAFDDYTAEIYMRGCPPGQYVGCAFVIGGRADVDWVVAGEVSPLIEGFELRLSYIDVAQSKLLLDFTVTVDETNEDRFAEGVVQVMDSVVTGAVEQLDVRGDLEEPERERVEAEREREELGEELDEFDFDLGEVERSDDLGVRTRRVTNADLDVFDEREDLSPWEQEGLSRGSYKRYRNSGKTLEMWDHWGRGRFGQVLLSIQFGVDSGPYGQVFDAWYARDAATLQVVHQYVLQEQRRALTTNVEFELGVGILPWLDVGVFGGVRSGGYSYRFHQEVVGQTTLPRDLDDTAASTWQLGARIGFAPLPTYVVRPTVHLGVFGWWGSEVTDYVQPPDFVEVLPRNSLVVLQMSPGGEVSIGRFLMVFARFNLDIAIAGVSTNVYEDPVNPSGASPSLSSLPTSVALGPGYGGSVGVTVRAPVWARLWNPRPKRVR